MSRTTLVALCAALTLTVSACGGAGETTADTPAAETTTAQTDQSQGAEGSLVVTDTWARAVPDLQDRPMTGVFGSIENPGDSPVTVTAATNSVSEVTELHETVEQDGTTMMRRVENFTIEPGGTLELAPGGDHLMVMDMTEPLEPGDVVAVTLTTDTGENVEFEAVAKTFGGADEEYEDGAGHGEQSESPHGGMEHGSQNEHEDGDEHDDATGAPTS